jgi:uncharacterized membrane protein
MTSVGYLSFGIGVVGIAIIVWGAVLGTLSFIKLEVAQARGGNICHRREMMRHHLGSYILLGLEFLVAADVVHTIIKPTLSEMAILGSIVAIRTVLSFFLNRELTTHTCDNASKKPSKN